MRWNGSKSSFSHHTVGFAGAHPPQLLSCAFTARETELGANSLARGLSSDQCHCWLQCVMNSEFLSQMHVLSCSQELTFTELKLYQGHIWQRNAMASRWNLTKQFPKRVKKEPDSTGKPAIQNSHHTLMLQCNLKIHSNGQQPRNVLNGFYSDYPQPHER